jgi:hypothetical protein
MHSPSSLLAPGSRPGPSAAPHLMPLAGDWALWRDIAVRTAGFPVSGLGIFGSPDERAGLRAVARDPLFQTAVTWQNRAAMANAVSKIAGVHAYDPFPAGPADGHSPRITIGRTVWRRETWDVLAAQGPPSPEAAAGWAADRGMPRQVFALSPVETKPVYVDFDSPVLTQILCRQLRRAATDAPGQPARFTEMLPAPQDCWLTDDDGQRYTSELRLVAVDLGRRAQIERLPAGRSQHR